MSARDRLGTERVSSLQSVISRREVRRVSLVLALLGGAFMVIHAWWRTCREIGPTANADALFPYMFATDRAPHAWRSWILTPAPSYLDLAVVTPLSRVLSSARAVHDAYAGIYMLALLGSSYHANRALGSRRGESAIFASLGVAAVYGSPQALIGVRGALYFPAIHATSLLLTVVAYGLLMGRLSEERDGRRSAATLVVAGAVVGAMGSGDTLFLVQFVAPLLLLLLLAGCGPVLPARFRHECSGFAAAMCAGFAAARAFLAALGPSVPERSYVVSGRALRLGLGQLWSFLAGGAVLTELSIPACALSCAWVALAIVGVSTDVLRGKGRLSKQAIATLFGLLVVGCSTGIPLVLGQLADAFAVRYVLPSLVLPTLLFAVPAKVAPRRAERIVRLCFVVLASVAALFVRLRLGLGSAPELAARFAPSSNEAPITRRVEPLIARGIHVGFASYWNAKPLALQLGQEARISSVNETQPHLDWWLANGDWLFDYDASSGSWSYPQRYFVLDSLLRNGLVSEMFGSPESVEEIGDEARLLVFRFDGARYAPLVRHMCTAMAHGGASCAPARGVLSLLPLLEVGTGAHRSSESVVIERCATCEAVALQGLDVPLLPGRYVVRLDVASGATELTLTVALGARITSTHELLSQSGHSTPWLELPFATDGSTPLHLTVARRATTTEATLLDLRLSRL